MCVCVCVCVCVCARASASVVLRIQVQFKILVFMILKVRLPILDVQANGNFATSTVENTISNGVTVTRTIRHVDVTVQSSNLNLVAQRSRGIVT